MRQFLAILGDSFREAADRRALLVLLALSLLPIGLCASLGFDSDPPEAVLRRQIDEFGTFRRASLGTTTTESNGSGTELRALRQLEDDQLGAALQGGLTFELAFAGQHELPRLAARWFRFHGEPGFAEDDEASWPARVDDSPREQIFLERRIAQFGWDHVAVRPSADPKVWQVAVRSEHPYELAGGLKVSAGFGAIELPVRGMTLAEFVVALQSGLAQVLVGFVGMLIALSATSAFVPNMLQKGRLDLVLARPIGRARLLLTKYLGGLWFVTCLATFVIGGCWLGLTLGSGYSNPWFLLSIATLVTAFAVLYSVSVLVGVLTCSSGIATLVALAVWFLGSVVVGARHAVDAFGSDVPAWLGDGLEVAYLVLPKIEDLDLLSTSLLARAHLSDAARTRILGVLPEVDWAFSLGSTAAFTAAMLALAVLAFRRRDY